MNLSSQDGATERTRPSNTTSTRGQENDYYTDRLPEDNDDVGGAWKLRETDEGREWVPCVPLVEETVRELPTSEQSGSGPRFSAIGPGTPSKYTCAGTHEKLRNIQSAWFRSSMNRVV